MATFKFCGRFSYKCFVRTFSDMAGQTQKSDPKIYLNNAMEAAKKWQMTNGVSSETVDKVMLPERVTVIGGGTMGTGIASSLAIHGFDVTVVESNAQAQERCSKSMQRITEKYATKLGRADQVRFSVGLSLDVANNSDLIIEAIIENMNDKIKLFRHLDSICPSKTIFATNTSTLDIDRIANSTNRPGRVVGMHFFTPAHINKLVEVIYGKHTIGSTIATIFKLSYAIDKVPILVQNAWGFAANRILFAYIQSCMVLVEKYALTPAQIDRALLKFGFGLGPFAVMDISGLDVLWNINKEANRPNMPLHEKMVRNGSLGVKTGKGWHVWEDGRPSPNTSVERLIREHCTTPLGPLDEKSIVQHCLYPVVNAAFDVLEKGIVSNESDIDLIYSVGFGWPRDSVGPMNWARNIEGLSNVVAGLQKIKALNGTADVSLPETNELLVKEAQTSKL